MIIFEILFLWFYGVSQRLRLKVNGLEQGSTFEVLEFSFIFGVHFWRPGMGHTSCSLAFHLWKPRHDNPEEFW